MSALRHPAVLWFLVLTFLPTYAIEILILLLGLPITGTHAATAQLLVGGVMFLPGLAAIVTTRFVTKEPWSVLRLRVGPLRPYFAVAALLPLCFALIALLTTATGVDRPDWELTGMMRLFGMGAMPVDLPSPSLIILAIAISTLLFVPFINGIPAFGEELGWRGFLLPRLLPLGRARAHLVLGLLWGLWHLPLLLGGFAFSTFSWWNIPLFFALTTGFGVFINELTLRYQSTLLAAWIHGVFNSQKLGVWAILFPGQPTVLGGYSGLPGMFVWLALGMITLLWCRRHPRVEDSVVNSPSAD